MRLALIVRNIPGGKHSLSRVCHGQQGSRRAHAVRALTGLAVVLLLGSSTHSGLSLAQEPDESAKGWHGTITYTFNEHKVTTADLSGSASGGGDAGQEGGIRGLSYTEEEDTIIEVVVQVHDGEATGAVRYQNNWTYKKSEAFSAPMEEESLLCPAGGMEFVMSAESRSITSAGGTVAAYLYVALDETGEYSVDVEFPEEGSVPGTTTNSQSASCSGMCCPDIAPSEPSSWESPYMADPIGVTGTAEPGAKHLTGSQTESLDNTEERGNGSMIAGPQETTGSWTLSWSLYQGDVELVVEPEKYNTWMPTGTGDELIPGNGIWVLAKLQTERGGDPSVEADEITFELLDVSKEPGTAMNWPPKARATTDFDLQFDPVANHEWDVEVPDGQRLKTPEGQYTHAQVYISAYDWGAYGTLRVTARLTDGRELTGYLKGDKSVTDISLPKRDADSHIADAWKRRHDLTDLPDHWDPEEQPRGDGFLGDGLTFYEEYRGFYEGGKHIRGNPRKKELFVHNKLGGEAVPGIKVFAEATGLVVHYKLTQDEMTDDQVINFNYSSEPRHYVNQHGLIMEYDPTRQEDAAGYAPLGPPGKSRKVTITSKPDGRNADDLNTIAHELGHAVNIDHHGRTDPKSVTWSQGSVNGTPVVLETKSDRKGTPVAGALGKPIKVYNEDNIEIEPSVFAFPQTIYLAGEHGQHSGDQFCFMRYDVASAHVRKSDPTGQSRYLTYGAGEDETSLALCSTKQGTGVNILGYEPQPRYGDATNGDCEHQIRVNDSQNPQTP